MEFFFRVHWQETGKTELSSNVISTKAADVDTAKNEISAHVPGLVSITHIGTVDDTRYETHGATDVNRGAW